MPEHSFPLIGGGVVILTVFVDRKNEACRMEKKIRTGTLRAAARQKVRPSSFVRCELFLRDIRDVEILASFRERGPGITHSDVVFACFWIMFCFLCERCASGSCFPCGLAFGSHLMFPSHPSSSEELPQNSFNAVPSGAVPLLLRMQLCVRAGRTGQRSRRKERAIRRDRRSAARSH
jgi:hypothetical protein